MSRYIFIPLSSCPVGLAQICAYIYICIHVSMHVHARGPGNRENHVHTCIYIYSYIYIYMSTCVCMPVDLATVKIAYTCVYLYVHVHLYANVCLHVYYIHNYMIVCHFRSSSQYHPARRAFHRWVFTIIPVSSCHPRVRF